MGSRAPTNNANNSERTRYAESYTEKTMGAVETQLSDSVRKLSLLARQVASVAATDLTPRQRGDQIAGLHNLAETFDTLAVHPTGRRNDVNLKIVLKSDTA